MEINSRLILLSRSYIREFISSMNYACVRFSIDRAIRDRSLVSSSSPSSSSKSASHDIAHYHRYWPRALLRGSATLTVLINKKYRPVAWEFRRLERRLSAGSIRRSSATRTRLVSHSSRSFEIHESTLRSICPLRSRSDTLQSPRSRSFHAGWLPCNLLCKRASTRLSSIAEIREHCIGIAINIF